MNELNEPKTYVLLIDGPLLREQRKFLLRIGETLRDGSHYEPLPGDAYLIEGLISLTDGLADQAHDRHGIDCLLVDDDRRCCECEKPGFFCSGIPGILAHLEDGRLAKDAQVNRCDLCQRYPSDEAASKRLCELGYGLGSR